MTWIYVIGAMLIAGLSSFVVGFILVIPEKAIQWGGKSWEYWKEKGVECPGERLQLVSIIFGAISTTISRCLMYLAGTWVFIQRHEYPSNIPMILLAVFMFLNDVDRVKKFKGSTGRPKEIGYLCGGIIALFIFKWIRTEMMS
jgi:hypothetical protein